MGVRLGLLTVGEEHRVRVFGKKDSKQNIWIGSSFISLPSSSRSVLNGKVKM
jgi:hypothetical protein